MSKENNCSNNVSLGKLALGLLIIVGLSGCSSAARDASDGDSTAPVVNSTTPLHAAQDVGHTVAITATFSEAMDATTLTATTFTVQSPEGPVPGIVTYDAASHVATFSFQNSIAGLTPYTATLSTAIKDSFGIPLAAAYSWNFTTTNIAWLHENGELVKVSSANEELKKIPAVNCTPLSGYTQSAIDYSDGSVWVADTNNNRLFKLDADGRLATLYSQNSAQGTAIDPRDGSVWSSEYLGTLTAARKLVKRSSLGLPVLETAGGLSGSMMNHSMDWNPTDHSLWFADYSTSVVKIADTVPAGYNASGATGLHHMRNSTFVQTMSLSVFPGMPGTSSHVWAAERGGGGIDNAIVQLNNSGGEMLRRSASGFFETRHVSADVQDGSVWAGAGNPDRLAKYTIAGDSQVNIGGFAPPFNDIAADPVDGGAWVGYGDGLVRLSSTGSQKWRRQLGPVEAVTVQTKRIALPKVYVSKTGNDTSGDGSELKPYLTITKALAVANPGDTVTVAAGIYNENVVLKSKVRLLGAGYAATTIQGLGTTNVVEGIAVTNATLEGFTITGASATTSGLYCADCNSVIVRNNHIRDNGAATSTTSNGILIQGVSNLLVEKNLITGNTTGGIVISGTSQALIRNNIVIGNGDSGISHGAGSLKSYIVNNVIDRNGNGRWGRSGLMIFSNDVISNNIISNNGGANPNSGLAVGIYVSTGTPTLSYNNVYGNSQGSYTGVAAGIGDISVDPKFVGAADYHLQSDSPSINTGDSALSDIGIACDTPARRSDMGAYGGPWGDW